MQPPVLRFLRLVLCQERIASGMKHFFFLLAPAIFLCYTIDQSACSSLICSRHFCGKLDFPRYVTEHAKEESQVVENGWDHSILE